MPAEENGGKFAPEGFYESDGLVDSSSPSASEGNFMVSLKLPSDTVQPNDIHVPVDANEITEDESELVASLETTITTLKVAILGDGNSPQNIARYNEYIVRLLGIARLGLQMPGRPALAQKELLNFKQSVVAREGPRIKNRYMTILGFWAVGFSVVFILVYVAFSESSFFGISTKGVSTEQLPRILWLLTGTMAGVWLSFGVRRVALTFDDLGRLEADMLDPPIRLLFTGVLALTLALMFWTKVISLKVGDLSTDDIRNYPVVALVVGLLCGIAEQALPSAVGGQAGKFVGSIGDK